MTFTVEGGSDHGGYDVHEGHGVVNRIGRRILAALGLHSRIPDRAVGVEDPTRATTLHLVFEVGWGGIDVYRI